MAKVEKITIALTQEMAAKVRAVVESGEYASTSEVIRDALRDWEQKCIARELALERFGQLIDEGFNSGEALQGAEVMANLLAKLEAKITKAA